MSDTPTSTALNYGAVRARSTAGDNETDQKGTIYANLKMLNADDICTNIHQFEKALVQVQESESGLERV